MGVSFTVPEGQMDAPRVSGLVCGEAAKGVPGFVPWSLAPCLLCFPHVLLGPSAPDGIQRDEGYREGQLSVPCSQGQGVQRFPALARRSPWVA